MIGIFLPCVPRFVIKIMGVETPIPPVRIDPAAPGGAPPRRFRYVVFL